MKDDVCTKIIGTEVDVFCRIELSFEHCVMCENNKKVLCIKLDKALFGCVELALLCHELYSTTLKDMAFELNPYDSCVTNKMIDENRCTIVWRVHDNKISHMIYKFTDEAIVKIESKFGKMSKTRGDKDDF